MPVAKPRPTNRNIRLLAAVALPVFFTACSTNDSSLLDLESLFPAEVFATANENGEVTGEVTGTGTGTATVTDTGPSQTETGNEFQSPVEEITTTNPGEQFTDVSPNGVPAELQVLLRGEISFTSRFNGTGDPVVDIFQFTPEDFELFPDTTNPGALSVVTDSTVSVCAFIPTTTQYLCMRAFDLQLQDRVWHLFNLQSDTNGSGIFEFCTEADTVQACSDKLFSNPDGTDVVTISSSLALASAPFAAAPYFAYGEQGSVNRQSSSGLVSEPYSQTVNRLITTANKSINE